MTGAPQSTDIPPPVVTPAQPVEAQRPREPSLPSMIIAALVLLVAIGIVLWNASLAPAGRSVVVTIRNP